MKLLLLLAWRNLWRHRRRSFLNMALLAISAVIIIFLVSMNEGVYDKILKNSIDLSVGEIQLEMPKFEEDPVIENFIFNATHFENKLKNIKEIKAFTPRIETYGLLSAKNTLGGAIVGIDPDREKTVSVLADKISKGHFLKQGDDQGVILGETLAQNLGVELGEELVVLTQDYYGQTSAARFTVRGLLSSGSLEVDNYQIFVNLKSLQNLLSLEDSVSKGVIRLKDGVNITRVQKELSDLMSPVIVKNWREKLKSILELMQMDAAQAKIITFIFGVVIFFGLLNTSLMNVLERTREIGVLKAVGTSPGHVVLQYFLETMILAVAGIGLGLVLGALLIIYFGFFPITISGMEEEFKRYNMDAQMYVSLKIKTLATTFFSFFIYCVVSSLYPALRASRISILKALQGN